MTQENLETRIRREADAAMRDANKKQAEEFAAKALKYAKQAYTLYIMAECPNFAAKTMDAAHLLAEVQVTTLKPGTRCECRDPNHGGVFVEHVRAMEGLPGSCGYEAVRMVAFHTIPSRLDEAIGMKALVNDRPMCGGCADFHERGSK